MYRNGNESAIMRQITTFITKKVVPIAMKTAFFCFLWTCSGQNYTLNFVDATWKRENHPTSENALLMAYFKRQELVI